MTDDNQLLAYGADPRSLTDDPAVARANAALVELARRGADIRMPPAPDASPAGWGSRARGIVAGWGLVGWGVGRCRP